MEGKLKPRSTRYTIQTMLYQLLPSIMIKKMILILFKQGLEAQNGKKGERSRILPSGNMVSEAQIHFPFKSRDPSGCKKYMEDNINEDIYPEDGREIDAISDRGNRGEVTLEYIGSEDTDVKERNWKEGSADIDDPT